MAYFPNEPKLPALDVLFTLMDEQRDTIRVGQILGRSVSVRRADLAGWPLPSCGAELSQCDADRPNPSRTGGRRTHPLALHIGGRGIRFHSFMT